MAEQEGPSQQGRALVEGMNRYSAALTRGDYQVGIDLIELVLPPGQDETPEYVEKLSATLNPRERLAIRVIRDFGGRFNENFGAGTNAGEHLSWENPDLCGFLFGLGLVVNGILNPDGEHGSGAVVTNMITTNEAYRDLVGWAQTELSAKGTSEL